MCWRPIDSLRRVVGDGSVSGALLTLAIVNLLAIPLAGGYSLSLGLIELSNPSGLTSVLVLVGILGYRFAWPRRRSIEFGRLWQYAYRYKTTVALSAIVAVGLGLRMWGVDFGFPQITHPDEPETAGRAIGMLRRGSLDPKWYIYPTFYMNLLLPSFCLYYISGKGRGLWESLEDVSRFEPGFYLIGRYHSVFFGTLTILLTYLLARQIWQSRDGERAGLISAALVAVSFNSVRQSHYALTNALLTGCLRRSLLIGQLYLRDRGGNDGLAPGTLEQ